ncbi:hypothetical protein SNOG_05021 [Parastagonospora nodorum SN15]|uniref:Uncharacterized protein n=1 Tax=Phaeosphaeria nodorum (strain SN15 / ATCC MYA-4574 / FGSC 10173) TaxID=321614 RepID=Q0UT93_PHANO|nr:hypothetical protein SNOG_05021 [Parastagonospora nodorum SN15]EAT87412.1 hypothetical protein SNOG_05021 [Parastagonospora nodorum SN15]
MSYDSTLPDLVTGVITSLCSSQAEAQKLPHSSHPKKAESQDLLPPRYDTSAPHSARDIATT